MSLRFCRRLLLTCILTAVFFALGATLSGARGVPTSEGILNFGKVNETLYRGAQPDEAGLESLHRLGVKTIINLRMAEDCWKEESAKAEAHGILYTNVPIRGMGRPTDEQVKIVLGIIESAPGPVFIHCRHGCDRTGTIVACYRMQHEKWKLEKALAEANRYGISVFERGMKRFIADFAKLASEAREVVKNEGSQSVASSK